MAKYAQGKYTVKNQEKYLGNRQPTYRSSWEFAFMKFCDEHPSVAKWASEAIKIPYRNPFTGKQTIYVPDFFVVYVDKNGKKRLLLNHYLHLKNILDKHQFIRLWNRLEVSPRSLLLEMYILATK